MAIKDLIPWNNNRSREVGFRRGTDTHPLVALHREMNRMFDDVFRGFELPGHSAPKSTPRSVSI
jgi:HSP20 family protein